MSLNVVHILRHILWLRRSDQRLPALNAALFRLLFGDPPLALQLKFTWREVELPSEESYNYQFQNGEHDEEMVEKGEE